MSTTLSGRRTHHKDGAKSVAYGVIVVVVVVVVVVVDVVEVLVDEVVVDGFTVDEVDVLEELEVLVELVDDVDPRLVPSSVG
jgi:Flp pilus assembly pilin Flp